MGMFRKKKTFKFRANPYAEFHIVYAKARKGFWTGFNFSRQNFKKIWPELSVFLAVLVLGWALLQSSRLAAVTLSIKEKILMGGKSGAEMLRLAKSSLEKRDLESAGVELGDAVENFKQSQQELFAVRQNFMGLSRLLPQERAAAKLLEGSLNLAEAGQSGLVLAKLTSNLSFGAQGLSAEADINEIYSQLVVFESKISRAFQALSEIDPGKLPPNERDDFEKNFTKVKAVADSAATLKSLGKLGQIFLTGKKNVLLLFENNNELRPTGGFMGSFGGAVLNNGKLESLKISSIYDLDGQLAEKIVPPSPIIAVNDRWFLRDSNWFTSFPESAALISAFYEKEGGETPDLIIALTPQTLEKIIEVTGPLKTPGGLTINEENLLEQIQILTTSTAEDPSNEPKKILGQLLTELLQKISQLDAPQKTRVLKALSESLSEKSLLAFSRIPEAADIFSQFNWAGQILPTDRDFLLMSFANLGGTKTDLSVQRSAALNSYVNRGGEIQNTLTISLKNLMPEMPFSENKTFVRVYVPEGSKLLSSEGFDKLELPAPDNEDYKSSSAIRDWEKTSVKDVVTGTVIGEESGKTFFGNWVILKAGESRQIKIVYQLPWRLKKLDRLSLMLQKQPGVTWEEFGYTLSIPGRQAIWATAADFTQKNGIWSLKNHLNKDVFSGMVLMQDN